MNIILSRGLFFLFLLVITISKQCTASRVYSTHIKTNTLYYMYKPVTGDEGKPNPSPNASFYLYELGGDDKFPNPDFHNYYLGRAGVTEQVNNDSLITGPGSATANSREVFHISYMKNLTNPDCCWKVTNAHTGDQLLNISKNSAIRNGEQTVNPLYDIASTFGPESESYVNPNISITYGGQISNNESYFHLTFEHMGQTLYLNGQQSEVQRTNPIQYASLGALRATRATTAPFDTTVRWFFTNKDLEHFVITKSEPEDDGLEPLAIVGIAVAAGVIVTVCLTLLAIWIRQHKYGKRVPYISDWLDKMLGLHGNKVTFVKI